MKALGWTALACALVLVGCGDAASPSAAAPSEGAPEEIRLPGPGELVPDDVAGATAWIEVSSVPNDFDPDSLHASPADLADAFGAAIHAGTAGSPIRPDLALDLFEETPDRAVLIISATGFGDDSVAGSQYALVVVREADGWQLDEQWTRALCGRGVSGDLCV